MTDRRFDPQGADEIWRSKLEVATDAFRSGEFPMTEPVYRATLYQLGFRSSEINAEVALARPAKTMFVARDWYFVRCGNVVHGAWKTKDAAQRFMREGVS